MALSLSREARHAAVAQGYLDHVREKSADAGLQMRIAFSLERCAAARAANTPAVRRTRAPEPPR